MNMAKIIMKLTENYARRKILSHNSRDYKSIYIYLSFVSNIKGVLTKKNDIY